MPPSEPPQTTRFCVDALPDIDRIGVWREVFGRKIVQLEMEQLQEDPLRYDATFHSLGRTTLGYGSVSSISCERTRAMTADANDDIVVVVPVTGEMRVEQAGQVANLRPGDALVRRSDEPGKTWSTAGEFLTVTLPQKSLSAKLADVDSLIMTVVPAGCQAMGLMTGYGRLIVFGGAEGPAAERAAGHLEDLVALALGASRDSWMLAQETGLRAARLLALKGIIARRATDADFTITELARQSGISPGHVRRLLAEDGESFSARVLGHRLAVAHRRLRDPALSARPISQIAYGAGFNDVSYFNRAFRKRFGATPSEVRAEPTLH